MHRSRTLYSCKLPAEVWLVNPSLPQGKFQPRRRSKIFWLHFCSTDYLNQIGQRILLLLLWPRDINYEVKIYLHSYEFIVFFFKRSFNNYSEKYPLKQQVYGCWKRLLPTESTVYTTIGTANSRISVIIGQKGLQLTWVQSTKYNRS